MFYDYISAIIIIGFLLPALLIRGQRMLRNRRRWAYIFSVVLGLFVLRLVVLRIFTNSGTLALNDPDNGVLIRWIGRPEAFLFAVAALTGCAIARILEDEKRERKLRARLSELEARLQKQKQEQQQQELAR